MTQPHSTVCIQIGVTKFQLVLADVNRGLLLAREGAPPTFECMNPRSALRGARRRARVRAIRWLAWPGRRRWVCGPMAKRMDQHRQHRPALMAGRVEQGMT